MAKKDLIYDESDTRNIQGEVKALSIRYNHEVIPAMRRAVNVMNILSDTKFLDGFWFQNIAKNLEKKTDDFYDMLNDTDKALGKAIDALSQGTTVSSDFFDNLDGLGPGCASGSYGSGCVSGSYGSGCVSGSYGSGTASSISGSVSTTPRINSPYDYADYLKKQGKDKEAASIEALLEGGVTGASLVSKNGTKSKNNNATNKNTGGYTTSSGTTVTDFPSKKDNIKEETTSQETSTEEELKQKEEELRKKEEELQHKEREQSDRETALDTQEKQLKEKEKELNEREKQLDQREKEIKAKEEELKAQEKESAADSPIPGKDNDHGIVPKPDEGLFTNEGLFTKEPEENSANTVSETSNDAYETPVQVDTSPNEQQPSSQVNNTQQNNSYQAPSEQANNDYSNQNVTVTTADVGGDSGSLGTGNDLFGDDPEPTTTTTTLPDADTTTKSSKSGFNPIPIAVGLGAAVAGGVGVKAYKNHKQNSEFDDANEDSFTNGNRFWTDDEPNVVNSEQNELSGDTLFNEQTTSPSYSAVTNQANNNDTWSVQDTSTRVDDSRTYDLLGEN